MAEMPSQQELEGAHCWEAEDRVPRRPEMTAFRRAMRFHQFRWRESKGFPIGTQPIRPLDGKPFRPVGSRVPLDFARETGANFVTAAAHDAAKQRLAAKEREQSLDVQGLWADLLSSVALSFNLFGDLAADLARADRAVHTWWPDAPGTVSKVRFAYSPGRLDPSYVGSLVAFDAAFELDLGDGTRGVVAVDIKYHERLQRHVPKPARLPRYLEVAETSGAFGPAAVDAVNGTDLLVMWLEHLLMLSMLQHPSDNWTWGRYVVIHPAGNVHYAEASARYEALLADRSTFSSMTLEDLLGSRVLARPTVAALRERYLPTRA